MSQPASGRGQSDNGFQAIFCSALPEPDWSSRVHAGTVVAFADTRAWMPWLPDAMALLDASERIRVARKRNVADRDGRTIAYALHRLLLGSALGVDPVAVPLFRDERGRPRVAGFDIHTSLSHSARHVAFAATAVGAVGIDFEPLARAAVMPEIAGSICHPIEAAALAGLSEPCIGEELLALWVRKEALLKAAGVGLAREMASFQAPAGACAVVPWWPGAECRIDMLDAGESWVAALASAPGSAVSVAWLSPTLET